ncbi:MAG: hypothetical protein HZB79_06905 [Deltaproteobacteria bacterium]|nr:hypothetical protein [Deltaproteobacteria bacterium]
MKNSVIVYLLIIASILFFSTATHAIETKPLIAFFTFVPKNIEATPLMDSIPSLLTKSVNKTGYFEIVERKRIEKEIELAGYKLSTIKLNELLKIGEKVGFDFGVGGDVLKQGGIITINIKVIDIRGQRVCFEHTLTTAEGALNDKIHEFTNIIEERTRECLANLTTETKKVEAPAPPPHDLKVKSSMKRVTISWSHAAKEDISGFKVYRGLEDGPYMLLGTTADMSFVDENPISDGKVFYKVAAIDKKGVEGRFSNPIDTRILIAPSPPIFLNIKADIKTAHLKWKVRPSSYVGGFKIYRKDAAEKDFKEIASVQQDIVEYSDKGLKDDAVYQYALTSIDPKGVEGDMSTILEVKTLKSPDGLKAIGGKIRQILLNWGDIPSDVVEGYVIYRTIDKIGDYKSIARIKAANTYMDRDSLSDMITYWYRISAYNKDGAITDFSESVSATTRGAPPIPQGFSAKSREPRMVSMKWDSIKSQDDEIKGYYIFRAAEEKGDYKNIAKITDPDINSFVDNEQPLKDNTVYYYKITSFNSVGVHSVLSGPAAAVTKALPDTPKGLKATSGEVKKATLVWELNLEKDIKEYILFRAVSEGENFSKITSVRGKTNYIDTNLKDGTKYIYTIQAVDEDNLYNVQSLPVTAVTKPVPVKPKGLKVSDANVKKILQWDANPEKDIKEYNVYKKGFLGISQKMAAVTDTSWSIPDDVKGKIEIFVTAVDETGLESEGSESVIVEKK